MQGKIEDRQKEEERVKTDYYKISCRAKRRKTKEFMIEDLDFFRVAENKIKIAVMIINITIKLVTDLIYFNLFEVGIFVAKSYRNR